VGSTDSNGILVITGVSAGSHQVVISKIGYKDYTATISMTADTVLYVTLNMI